MGSMVLHNQLPILAILGNMVTIIRKKTPKNRLRAVVKRAKAVPQEGFDTRKHVGKWKLDEDALVTQKRLRDEWE